MVATSSQSTSLKEYLKKYTSNNEDDKKKKKKKKNKKPKPDAIGVLVVDQDPVWQKPVEPEDEDNSQDEEKPQVDEDVEVKRMKRLEQNKSRRPFGSISEDGSGWISLPQNSTNISPPHVRRSRNDTPSPENEQRHEIATPGDLSPPRKARARYDSPSPEPYRESNKAATDLSPPRRRNNSSSSRTVDSDMSPPRRSSSAVDLSPPRKSSTASIPDLSPPRKRRKESPAVVNRPKTGLVSGRDVKEENDTKKKEDLSRFKAMDSSISGRNAEPIYRSKITGERLSKEEFLKTQKGKQKEEKPKEIKLEWGKGLAQKRDAEARMEELEVEKDKPFARHRDDPDLDRALKERVRWGDPMAHLVKNKHVVPDLPDLGDNDKMKESGFIIPQGIPSHSWIKRGLEAATNRYGIKPGRHWDGVDRSNGYEKEMYKRTSEKQATEREAYLWSVADM